MWLDTLSRVFSHIVDVTKHTFSCITSLMWLDTHSRVFSHIVDVTRHTFSCITSLIWLNTHSRVDACRAKCISIMRINTQSRVDATGWRRPLGCLICIGLFPQKSLIFSGSCADIDLQLKGSYGSTPLCSCAEIPHRGYDSLHNLVYTLAMLSSKVIFRKRATNYRALLRKTT